MVVLGLCTCLVSKAHRQLTPCRFPVTLTLLHVVVGAICTWFTTQGEEKLTRQQLTGTAVLGAAFAAGILLGNVSLLYIPVSLDQAIGASTPAFVALLNIALLAHKEPFSVYLSLVPIIGK